MRTSDDFLEQIIQELMSRKKKLLIICFGSNLEEAIIYDFLERWQSECEYDFVFSNEYQNHFDISKWLEIGSHIKHYDRECQKKIMSYDAVLVPYLTRNSLAKLAIGIADTDALSILLQCLLNGKKVMASNHCWRLDTDNAILRELDKNSMLNKLYESHQKTIQSMGVQSASLSEWKIVVEELIEKNRVIEKNENVSSKRVLTLNDIKKNPIKYKETKHRMTDLAKEYLLDFKEEV